MPLPHVICQNLVQVHQVRDLVARISPEQYKAFDPRLLPGGGIASHCRHMLDYYRCFMAQRHGLIDYDARGRDPHLEEDPRLLSAGFDEVERFLSAHLDDPHYVDQPVRVRDNDHHGLPRFDDLAPSSIGRELQFLLSHTVHHCAIVAIILRLQGVEPPADFGVAPSTLRYEQRASAPLTSG